MNSMRYTTLLPPLILSKIKTLFRILTQLNQTPKP